MSACILGCQYIPSVEYFAHWYHHQHVALEANEHYQKRSWRNRTCILSPSEPLTLTVPLRKGKHQQLPVREVLISYDEPWVHQHIQSLQTAYGKTAFAEEVFSNLFPVLDYGYEKLWDLNLACLELINSFMPFLFTYELTVDYIHIYGPGQIDLRNGIQAGSASLTTHSIPAYPQVNRLTTSFLPNLSILDVLCHLGPGSLNYVALYAAQLYPST